MLDFGFYNMDCMEGMKEFPDKYFDLAIVDPPYRDENDPDQWQRRKIAEGNTRKQMFTGKAPTSEYFEELKRVSKNQIIWGGEQLWLQIQGFRGLGQMYQRSSTVFASGDSFCFRGAFNSVKTC